MEITLDAGLGATVSVVLIVASFATSFISAAFGVGGGAVLIALMASLLPPVALIPVHGIVQLGSNMNRVVLMRKHIESRLLIGFIAGSLGGIMVGGYIATIIPAALVTIGVGVFVLWSVMAPPTRSIPGSTPIVGVISGILTMFFGATGLLISAWLKTLRLDRLVYVATQATCMSTQHFMKVVAFGFLGFSFMPWLGVILFMLIAGLLGTLLGRRALMKSNEKLFKRILNSILIVLAIQLILKGMIKLYQAPDSMMLDGMPIT